MAKSLIEKIRDAIRANRPIAGVGHKCVSTPYGIEVHNIDDEENVSSSTMRVVQIVSGTGEDHIANIYADGPDKPATEAAVAIKVLQINVAASIPAGTRLRAWRETWFDDGVTAIVYWTVSCESRWY